MSGQPLRVVFDTNAFMPSNFAVLAEGPFLALCGSKRIEPIYGHVFLEETFRAYGQASKRDDLINKWIPLIGSTVGRFCKDFISIWHEELVRGRGAKANIYMDLREQKNLLANLQRIPLDGSWPAFHLSANERAAEISKREAQRDTSVSIRQEVAQWRKEVNYDPRKHGTPNFERYSASEIDHAGRVFIRAQVKCSNPDQVASRWSRNKEAYPYFTMFVRNMLYICFCAATKTNTKIDLNAQADLDLMTHLLRADALVSNETGFLRSAFEDIWRPRGKVLFTSEQFANFIDKL